LHVKLTGTPYFACWAMFRCMFLIAGVAASWFGAAFRAAHAEVPPPALKGSADCWMGSMSPALCCDVRNSLQGDSRCWDETFTFEACCPEEAELVNAEIEKSCWVGSLGEARNMCCDIRKSLRGDSACWGDRFTFETCCRAEAAFVKSAPTDSCWYGDSQPSVCCDLRKGFRGDGRCWDNLFSFELCCPAQALQAASMIEDSCWVGVLSPRTCCDMGKGPRGDDACWNDAYNFEACCTPKVFAALELEHIQDTCWAGVDRTVRDQCCDIKAGLGGVRECWNGPYNFQNCCFEEMRTVKGFADNCWIGSLSHEFCCDQRKGPRGDVACWSGLFQFETCCPHEVLSAALQQ